jgi:hypothetical protein
MPHMTPPTPMTAPVPGPGSSPRRQDDAARRRTVVGVGGGVPGHASSARADGCATAALGAQSNSTALPDCRACEMAGPPYKQGLIRDPQTINEDGAVAFVSPGRLGDVALGDIGTDNLYVGTHSTARWTTMSPNPGRPISVHDGQEVPGEASLAGASVDGRVIFSNASCHGAVTQVWARAGGSATVTVSESECTRPADDPARACNGARAASYVRVQSGRAVSQDGSRVYFVAQGVLADDLDTNIALAVDSASDCQDTRQCHNSLYLWSSDVAHPEGRIRFVTDLGAGVSGSGGNTSGIDVVANNEPAGTMSADGSTIVFVTDEVLWSEDVDGVSDVCGWREGRVSLISDGRSGGRRVWVTPSGCDIFFVTGGRVTALDGDVNQDIHDARVGGGFDLGRPARCFGDSCGVVASSAPGLPGPGGGSGDRGSVGVVSGFWLGAVTRGVRS